MVLLALYGLLALAVSFLCSILEAVLLSVTPAFVEARAEEGSRAGRFLRSLKDDIDRPLAAILSLNTIAHTVGAVGVGAQATHVWGSAAVGVTSAVMTLLILVLSEIIPKTLGAVYWRQLAAPAAPLLVGMVWLLRPLVWMSQFITRALARRGGSDTPGREEIQALAELGAREGVMGAQESYLLRHVLRFGSLRVEDIMTPRTVMWALRESATVAEALEGEHSLRFSRIPVYGENPDDVTGFVLKDDLLLHAARDEHNRRLGALRRDIHVVSENLPVPELFTQLLDRQEQIALVLDEYGGTAGVVTMEDVVETVLGLEIVDEHDSVRDMQELARREWAARARRLGLLPADDLPADRLTE